MWRATRSRKQQRRQPQPTPEGTLLAALPKEIQDDVLARLPARDAVRTSLLSPAWRHRWESVPNLDIDLSGIVRSSWDTAASTLQRCAAPIRRLRIHGVPPGLADGLLHVAAGKRPRSVSLDLPAAASGVPPHNAAVPSVFACDADALAELRLGGCALPAPPSGFAGFHALNALDLDGVVFTAENGCVQLEAMLAAAPGLRDLRLKDIVFRVAAGVRWVIGGPSLRRLVLSLRLAGAGDWELGALPKLECAHVFLNDPPSDRDYIQLFNALSTVRELKISNLDSLTLHQEPIVPGSLSREFKNLRVLKLDTNFYFLSTYISTYCLLFKAPFLQVLEITDYFRGGKIAEVDKVAGCLVTSLMCCSFLDNLEYLRMISISCSENDMYFIKRVLHTARNLQEVSVDMFQGSRKCAQGASRELKESQRASPQARISVKYRDSVCNA
ncbi:unnamed protein product [Urochloa decumbens]|uniref:F-box domain-containing protein n=1 Tax=Urochloa decumbens TaxID=240449 RepID=A0ABC9G963_9POAL